MGAFIVDDEPKADNLAAKTEVRLNVPTKDGDKPKSKESTLPGHVEAALEKRTGRFDSVNQLKGFLAADEIRYTATHLPVALEILVSQGRLLWPEGC